MEHITFCVCGSGVGLFPRSLKDKFCCCLHLALFVLDIAIVLLLPTRVQSIRQVRLSERMDGKIWGS